METALKIKLHVLSPVHIGCGDVYEPSNFVINPDAKKLIVFDPLAFINILNEKERNVLINISGKGTLVSIIELYRFIFEKRSMISGREVDVSDSLVKRYIAVKGMNLNENQIKQELNNFLIPRTSYNVQNNAPYIPGSSLKGSLRTGFLSMLAIGGGSLTGLKNILDGKDPEHPIEGRKVAKELEKELIGDFFDKDPFRMVKVSDLLPDDDVRTRVLYATNRKKVGETDAKGIPQILEVIDGGSTFEGIINIQDPHDKSGIRKLIAAGEVKTFFRAVNKHFARVYKAEKDIIEKLGFAMPQPLKKHGALKENAFLVRLGRHSGAESVTIEGNRTIKIMQGRGRETITLDHATTLWLAADKSKPAISDKLVPFGWAVLEIAG